ncbi:MAG: C39 family peptidase [Tumebacillaceae bacterium]
MKKKSLLIAVAATLLMTSQLATAASPKTAPVIVRDVIDPATFEEAPTGTTTTTSSGSISTEAVSLSVPLLSQSGETWSSSIMQTCGSTIGSEGCALTATTMVFKFHGVSIAGPGAMNNKLGSYACPIYWSEAVTRAGDGIVNSVATSSPTTWSSVFSAAKTALDNNRPYIVGMNKASGGTHFVVITGYSNGADAGGDFTINDPAGGVKRTLAYYSTNGATPYRGVIYKK